MPAQSTAVIDAPTEREWLECPGDTERHPSPVVACGGRAYRHTELCCQRRYWVALETPCDAPTDWTATFELVGLDRV